METPIEKLKSAIDRADKHKAYYLTTHDLRKMYDDIIDHIDQHYIPKSEAQNKTIAELVNIKADQDNTIDLEAYAKGLRDAFQNFAAHTKEDVMTTYVESWARATRYIRDMIRNQVENGENDGLPNVLGFANDYYSTKFPNHPNKDKEPEECEHEYRPQSYKWGNSNRMVCAHCGDVINR